MQTEDVGGEIGKLGSGEGNLRHGVLGQHDARSDGACGLPLAVGDLVKLGTSALAGCCC